MNTQKQKNKQPFVEFLITSGLVLIGCLLWLHDFLRKVLLFLVAWGKRAVVPPCTEKGRFVWVNRTIYGKILLVVLVRIGRLLWSTCKVYWMRLWETPQFVGGSVTLLCVLLCLYGVSRLLGTQDVGDPPVLMNTFIWFLILLFSCLVVGLSVLLGAVVTHLLSSMHKRPEHSRLTEHLPQTGERVVSDEQLQMLRKQLRSKASVSSRATAPSRLYVNEPPVFQAAVRKVMEDLYAKAPRRYKEVLALLPQIRYTPSCKRIIVNVRIKWFSCKLSDRENQNPPVE